MIIIEKTTTDGSQKLLQMSNGQCVRRFSFGSTWTQIRIGFRIRMKGSNVTITGTPKFYVGIVPYAAPYYVGDTSTTNFFGVAIDTRASWAYATNSTTIFRWDVGTGGVRAIKKVAGVLTAGNSGNAGTFPSADTGSGVDLNTRLAQFFIEFTKSGSDIIVASSASGTSVNDVLYSTFISNMQSATLAGMTDVSTMFAASTLSVDEATNGYLDSVNLSWNRTDYLIEIAEISVAKLS